MRRMAMFAGAAAVALFASTASAQAKVGNFAGKWIVVDSTTLGRGGRGGFGQTVTFVQDAGTLTAVRVGPNGEVKSIYKLDGSESKNTVTMRGASVEESAKAMWMSDTLMVATSRMVNGATVGTVMHLYLDNKTGTLVVTTTSPGRGGGPEQTVKVVYKKGM